jgi:hypothetical protein
VADFDRDGVPEIVVPGGAELAILRADGTHFPGSPLIFAASVINSPIVADLDGDQVPDLLAGTEDRRLHAVRLDGSDVPGWPVSFHERPWSTPCVADVDGDSRLDVALGADDLVVRVVATGSPDVPGAAPWPAYHGSVGLRGTYQPPVSSQPSSAAPPRPVPAGLAVATAPNPFRSSTRVEFSIPAAGPVALDVFDVAGRRVASPLHGVLPMGCHVLSWDGMDAAGRSVAAGVYFLRVAAGSEVRTVRVLRVR